MLTMFAALLVEDWKTPSTKVPLVVPEEAIVTEDATNVGVT